MDKNRILTFLVTISFGFLALLLFGSQLKFLLLVLLGISIILVTFIRADLGLIFLILSMLLSPEIKIGEVPGRDIVIRLDDIIIGIVFFSWLARIAIYKELAVLRYTRLNRPIGIYVGLCLLFTLFGAMRGDLILAKGFFYLLKYLEYFLIYFMVVNILEDKKQIRLYLLFLFITCGIVCIYAATQIGTVARISAPFEGAGEPNTLGGYLIIMTGIAIGLLFYSPSLRTKFLLLGFIGLTSVCIAYTLSRCTYMAFPFMYFTILAFSERKRGLIMGALLMVLAFIVFKPKVVIDRIKYTFVPEIGPQSEQVFGISVGPSASARLTSWRTNIKEIWGTDPISAVIGTGITGRGFMDGQYARTLIELGIIGILVFIYLLWCIGREYLYVYKSTKISLYKGLALGGLGALIGIYAHAVTANSFIIIRIQEPLWFLTAMIVRLPALEKT